jgi:HSP20 family molecular chaperone IbpA
MNGYPEDMFDEVDELFSRLFARMDREFMDGSPQVYGYRIEMDGNGGGAQDGMAEIPVPVSRDTREPVAEVHRIGDETMVIAELPGAREDTIRLSVNGSTLVIDAGEAEDHYHSTAALPSVDVASMQHTFKNGVLEVIFRNLPAETGTTVIGRN